MGKATPMAVPQINIGVGRYKAAYRKQQSAYLLLKKVLVHSGGNIFRATDAEIVNALKDVEGGESVRDFTGREREYVFAVEQVFSLRR